MLRFTRILALLLGVLLLAGLVAACGGGGGDDEEKEPTATAPVATEEAPEDTPEAPSGALPFDSFHYSVDLEFTVSDPTAGDQGLITGSVEGDYVAPDSHAFQSSFEFAGLSGTQEVVIIGDDAWIREGGGDWTATTADDPQILDAIDLTSADPGFLSASDLAEGISALDSEPEEINGVNTRRYHIPKEAVDTLVSLLGEDFLKDASGLQEFEMTVWLAEEGDALIRAELTATASPELLGSDTGFDISPDATVSISMVIDVTDINDNTIEIEPPI